MVAIVCTLGNWPEVCFLCCISSYLQASNIRKLISKPFRDWKLPEGNIFYGGPWRGENVFKFTMYCNIVHTVLSSVLHIGLTTVPHTLRPSNKIYSWKGDTYWTKYSLYWCSFNCTVYCSLFWTMHYITCLTLYSLNNNLYILHYLYIGLYIAVRNILNFVFCFVI